MKTRYRITLYCSVTTFLFMIGAYYFVGYRVSKPSQMPNNLPAYTAATLIQYNGEKNNLPIYIALDGYVYDVTAGKSFYALGGTYHNIAGKDASRELHIFGGSIIKEKYPIVGIFVPSS